MVDWGGLGGAGAGAKKVEKAIAVVLGGAGAGAGEAVKVRSAAAMRTSMLCTRRRSVSATTLLTLDLRSMARRAAALARCWVGRAAGAGGGQARVSMGQGRVNGRAGQA